jgi:RNA polymerase sigma factor (sigma-70 family)
MSGCERMAENWQTKNTLLMRAKDPDDQAAWEEFVSYYRDFIQIVLFQMKLPEVDSDDLTQEILIKIWKCLPNHIHDDNRARFRTWLSRLIRNQVIDYFRSEQRRTRRHQAAAEDESIDLMPMVAEPEVERIIESEWEVYIVERALQNISGLFSDRAIEAFTSSVDGMSTERIAERLGIKPNSVIKLKQRVKNRLKLEIRHLRRELESI